MTNRLVPFLAFVLFLSLVANLSARLFRNEPPPVGPTRTTLAAMAEIPGVTKTPAGNGPVLRMVVLDSAPRGDATALIDVKEVVADVPERLDVPFAGSRALLPEFHPINLGGEARIYRVARRGEFAVVHASWSLDRNAPVQGTRQGSVRPILVYDYPERWVVRIGEPLVRVSDDGTAALAVVILDRERAAATDGGTLAFWRDLFRETGKRPLLDEAEVAATVALARPDVADRKWGAGAQPPLNAALGLWMLGDREGLDELRDRVRADDGFLERALTSLRRERHDEEWVRQDPVFALQILGVLPFDGRVVQKAVDTHVGPGMNLGESGAWRLRRSSPFRTVRLLDDPAADEVAALALEDLQRREPDARNDLPDYEHATTGHAGRWVLEHDPPVDRPAVVEAWAAAREKFLSTLPRTLRLRRESPGVLAAILVGIAFASLFVALIRRGPREPLRIRAIPLLALYAGTQLVMNGTPLGHLLAPAWLVLFLLWLRSDVGHPWWERAAIGITLFSSAVGMAFMDTVSLLGPAVATLADAWYGFAWVVLGRIVLEAPEQRDSVPFRAFLTLHVFTVVQGTAAVLTGAADRAGPALFTTIGVAATALLWFSLEEPIRRLRERFRRD